MRVKVANKRITMLPKNFLFAVAREDRLHGSDERGRGVDRHKKHECKITD